MDIGARIDETGMLLREGGSFWLKCDTGARFALDLHRTPIDEVEKRVRVIGSYAGEGRVEVDGLSLT